jgi:hypothetical protein
MYKYTSELRTDELGISHVNEISLNSLFQ